MRSALYSSIPMLGMKLILFVEHCLCVCVCLMHWAALQWLDKFHFGLDLKFCLPVYGSGFAANVWDALLHICILCYARVTQVQIEGYWNTYYTLHIHACHIHIERISSSSCRNCISSQSNHHTHTVLFLFHCSSCNGAIALRSKPNWINAIC